MTAAAAAAEGSSRAALATGAVVDDDDASRRTASAAASTITVALLAMEWMVVGFRLSNGGVVGGRGWSGNGGRVDAGRTDWHRLAWPAPGISRPCQDKRGNVYVAAHGTETSRAGAGP